MQIFEKSNIRTSDKRKTLVKPCKDETTSEARFFHATRKVEQSRVILSINLKLKKEKAVYKTNGNAKDLVRNYKKTKVYKKKSSFLILRGVFFALCLNIL